jgi:hypothetical protein
VLTTLWKQGIDISHVVINIFRKWIEAQSGRLDLLLEEPTGIDRCLMPRLLQNARHGQHWIHVPDKRGRREQKFHFISSVYAERAAR